MMTFDDWLAGATFPLTPTGREIAFAAWNAAIIAEREECAKLCERLWSEEAKDGLDCAYAIRALGSTTPGET